VSNLFVLRHKSGTESGNPCTSVCFGTPQRAVSFSTMVEAMHMEETKTADDSIGQYYASKVTELSEVSCQITC